VQWAQEPGEGRGEATQPGLTRIVFSLSALDPVSFLIALALASAISLGVFAHANRHGSRHATAWGVAAFLMAGITVPVYFIRYWARRRRTPVDGDPD